MSVPARCKWHWLAGLWLVLWAGCGMAREAIDLGAYQSADGAIRLQTDGDLVDPYFAMKALLVADGLGLPVKPAAEAWIAWLLPRREAGGSFPRFVAQPGGGWKRMANADADDSSLALWISLLYRVYGDSAAMPPELQQSLLQARADLLRLRVRPTGIYHYARAADVGYLMDNAEVYEALRDDCQHGGKSCRLARQLELAVGKVFWDARRRVWRTASHGEPVAAFYPRTAAQLFPLMAGMPMPRGQRSYDDWLAGEGLPWLLQDAEVLDFAWGLLTVAAIKNQRDDVAQQWMTRAAPSRNGQRWNVLEEAVFQGLEQRFGPLAK